MRQLLHSAFFVCWFAILTLYDLQAHTNTSANARNLVQTKPKPTHVPDDWDNDDDEAEEEMDSQAIWETAYAILL